MKHLGLILLLLFILSCSNKTLNSHEEIVSIYYRDNTCINLNENYLCINNQNKTNNFQKVLDQKQPINPKLYNISSNFYNKNNIKKLLTEKLKISEKKSKASTIYSDDGERIIEEGYKEKYEPIYSNKLSKEFNKLLLKSIEESSLDKNLILGIKKETIKSLEKTILKFFRKDSIIISINNYNDISIHINKDVYNYVRKHHLQKVTKLNISRNIKNLYYKNIVERNEKNIINIFSSKKNTVFSISDIQKLNKEISSLYTSSLKGLIKDVSKENKDFEYILSRGYQFLIDILALSQKDKNKFQSLLNLDNLNTKLNIDRKIFFDFYKKHPLKVFITQTNNYHSPEVDGRYGYLYINKKDAKKLKDKKLMKYLLAHEVKHVTYHFVSLNKQFNHFFTFFINLADNIMHNKTLLIEEADTIIDSTINLLAHYDNEKRFHNKLPKLSKTLKTSLREVVQELSKKYDKQTLTMNKKVMLNKFFSIQNKKKLNYLEEWGIDKGNLHTFNFRDKQLYYEMLKEMLPKNHTRLKAIEKEFILYKIREEKFNDKNFELVILLDSILNVLEEIPENQKPKALREITEAVLKEMFKGTKKAHSYLKKLNRKNEMYYFINDFYGININESKEQLSKLSGYIRFKIKMRKALMHYAKTSLTTGEL